MRGLVESGSVLQFFVDGIDVGTDTRTNVVNFIVATFERKDICACDIRYETKITFFIAFTIDGWRLAIQHFVRKNRDDPGFAKWVLARTINVRITQHRIFQTIVVIVQKQIVLDMMFAGTCTGRGDLRDGFPERVVIAARHRLPRRSRRK